MGRGYELSSFESPKLLKEEEKDCPRLLPLFEAMLFTCGGTNWEAAEAIEGIWGILAGSGLHKTEQRQITTSSHALQITYHCITHSVKHIM